MDWKSFETFKEEARQYAADRDLAAFYVCTLAHTRPDLTMTPQQWVESAWDAWNDWRSLPEPIEE